VYEHAEQLTSLLATCYLFGSLFDSEDGSSTFLRNVGRTHTGLNDVTSQKTVISAATRCENLKPNKPRIIFPRQFHVPAAQPLTEATVSNNSSFSSFSSFSHCHYQTDERVVPGYLLTI
jgi:hypothetical protein